MPVTWMAENSYGAKYTQKLMAIWIPSQKIGFKLDPYFNLKCLPRTYLENKYHISMSITNRFCARNVGQYKWSKSDGHFSQNILISIRPFKTFPEWYWVVQSHAKFFPNFPEQRDHKEVVLSRSRQFRNCLPVSSCLVPFQTQTSTIRSVVFNRCFHSPTAHWFRW